jgi:hypothetical protein
MHTGCRVFIRKETRTYLNTHVPRVALFFDSVSTLTLKSSHKTMTVGAHRGAHEIKFHEQWCFNLQPSFFPAQGGSWVLSCF